MWTLIFIILLCAVFIKVLKFAVKATWGLAKIILFLILLPIILIGLVLSGLIIIALPVLAVIGIIAFLLLRD